MKITNCRVLLTGATGGIGMEMANALVGAGASVMLVGRSPSRLGTQFRDLLARHHVPFETLAWHAVDLAKDGAPAELADVAADWGCNVVVHNAGLPAFGRIESVDPATMAKVLHLNLLVPMLLTQSLLPHMRRQAQAHVVCVGSALGRIGLPGFSVYCASKFGLRGFAESLRRELGGGSLHVQYLGPRSTRTAFNDSDVERFNQATKTSMDTPSVVARALLDLLDSEAAESFIGFPEKLAVRVNGAIPSLLDGSFARHRDALPATAPPAHRIPSST